MKQLLRIFVALSALGVLTVYFFSDFVLIEPTPLAAGGESSTTSSSAPLLRQDTGLSEESARALIERGVPPLGGLSVYPSISPSPAFRGMTGSSGGAISSFKEKWQSLYSRWPMGKKNRKSAPSISSDPFVLHQRIGNLLTLVSLVAAMGGLSLAINLAEEKARV